MLLILATLQPSVPVNYDSEPAVQFSYRVPFYCDMGSLNYLICSKGLNQGLQNFNSFLFIHVHRNNKLKMRRCKE